MPRRSGPTGRVTAMMRRIVITLPVLAVLTGCVASPAPDAPTAEVEKVPSVDCLEVTDATVAGVQWGVDDRQDGLTVTHAAAIVNPAPDTESWFVSARIEGPGMGDDAVGVWNTLQDPTTAEGDAIAFVSVDAMAAEFSSYVQPDGFSSAIDGVDDVRSCLANG